MAHDYVETNEGVGENDELLNWLKVNKLLSAKEKFLENDLSLDELRELQFNADELELINMCISVL